MKSLNDIIWDANAICDPDDSLEPLGTGMLLHLCVDACCGVPLDPVTCGSPASSVNPVGRATSLTCH